MTDQIDVIFAPVVSIVLTPEGVVTEADIDWSSSLSEGFRVTDDAIDTLAEDHPLVEKACALLDATVAGRDQPLAPRIRAVLREAVGLSPEMTDDALMAAGWRAQAQEDLAIRYVAEYETIHRRLEKVESDTEDFYDLVEESNLLGDAAIDLLRDLYPKSAPPTNESE